MRTSASGSVSVSRSDVVFASVLRSLPTPRERAHYDAELADAATLWDYPRADPAQLEGFLAEYTGEMVREEKCETEVTRTEAMTTTGSVPATTLCTSASSTCSDGRGEPAVLAASLIARVPQPDTFLLVDPELADGSSTESAEMTTGSNSS